MGNIMISSRHEKKYIYFQFYHEFIKVGFEKFNFFMVRAIIDNKNIPKGVIFVPLYPGVTLSWEPSFIEIHNTRLHVKGTKVIADIVVLVIFKDKLNLCPALLVCWKIYSCTEVLVHFWSPNKYSKASTEISALNVKGVTDLPIIDQKFNDIWCDIELLSIKTLIMGSLLKR